MCKKRMEEIIFQRKFVNLLPKQVLIMINYQFFPRSHGVTTEIKAIIDCFKQIEPQLEEENVQRTSNEVLALVRPHLEAIGFAVETGKGKEEKIDVPVRPRLWRPTTLMWTARSPSRCRIRPSWTA